MHDRAQVEHRGLPPDPRNEAAASLLLCVGYGDRSSRHQTQLVVRLSLPSRKGIGKYGIDVMLQGALDGGRTFEELPRIQRALVLLRSFPVCKRRSLAEREKNDVSAAHES